MLELIWLIPLLPFVGFLLNALLVGRIGDAHTQERSAGYVAVAAVAAAFVLALVAFVQLGNLPEEERLVNVNLWTWINAGDLVVPFGLMFDPLTGVMTLLVTGVGTLIHIYSIGYMHGDSRVVRYFAYLNLFITMMLFLVMANNMLLLFLGWEGVGLCSFLLIGYWFERKSASSAAVKAFVVNRIGDAAILLAMMTIFLQFGTLNFFDMILDGAEVIGFVENAGAVAQQIVSVPGQDFRIGTIISFLLLIGVTGKSAQIPLFVWLPDAMAGPTPVSALIHAATMVTAGVYLIARTHPIFTDTTLGLVTWIGALTALVAATAAVAQWDIKRVLAYSTVSQLGYMVAAAGMGIYVAAIFHLLTHGIFKALLFLGSGSVIHGTHDTQDMRKMGGLRTAMPYTFVTYLIGAAALAGVFPLAGFWSKDEIVGHALTHTIPIFIILFLSSLLTAFYMGRQLALVFWGEQRDHSYHAHESGAVMWVPLVILAALTVVAGGLNLPGSHWLTDWLFPVMEEEAAEFKIVLGVVATLAAIGAGFGGWYLYAVRWAKRIKVDAKDPLYRGMGDIWDTMAEAWFFDTVYNKTIVPGYRSVAGFFAQVFDPEGIDGLVNGVGRAFGWASNGVRFFQNGYVRSYALAFFLGVVVIVGYLIVAL
ncbi:MAG: NADH-quinone oxidoreductase subunit L [Chloroflexaceae bacterium]|nr:NADH-quinone oxidoreductase subunit L [Chloroflexaceae bacterium]NJL33598.1 NADH-quinone oxidoreductase subunit L [Chloroflexaceae bacterium]NJO06915.1 NADH-quinone oxidoreductase subunit L [Chloroflexaceae bacterium]